MYLLGNLQQAVLYTFSTMLKRIKAPKFLLEDMNKREAHKTSCPYSTIVELKQHKRMGGRREKKRKDRKHLLCIEGKADEGLKVVCQVSSSTCFEGIINKGQEEQSYDSEL